MNYAEPFKYGALGRRERRPQASEIRQNMYNEDLTRQFEKMGARVLVGPLQRFRLNVQPRLDGLVVDVKRDRRGEYFDFQLDTVVVELQVVDVQPAVRHLLMLARHLGSQRKDKFLCGHDERSWFVAAVPNQRGVCNVRTALEALKPPPVREAQAPRRVKYDKRSRRKTAAYVRQGEWFFIPQPDYEPDESLILRNEPLIRGGGKPHICQYLVREGDETAYVSRRRPRGLDERAYRALLRQNARARSWSWTVLRRNPDVYVYGSIRHPDHRTLKLHHWHQVHMNTESQAPAMRQVAFID